MPRLLAPHYGMFDQATGQWIGVQNIRGEEQLVLTPAQIAALTANGVLSGVTYDASNRAVAWTIDGVAYSANYSPAAITVAGSDGTTTVVSLDPAARITGVTPA